MHLILLYGVFLPFLVWPVEYFLPLPFIVEELAKYLVVLLTIDKVKEKKHLFYYFIGGLLFAFTETVFYIINTNTVGSYYYFFQRFVLTSLLHSLTFLTIGIFSFKNKYLGVIGVIVSITIHYLFNLGVN